MSSTRQTAFAVLITLISLLMFAAGPVAAAEFRTGERITVAADETVTEDVYVAAGTSIIEGTIDGDLTVAGGVVEVRGTVTGSVNVAGGDISVAGTVGGTLRAAGGNVTVSGAVGRDLIVVGGNVTITTGATVGADVAGGVGTLDIAGDVDGDIDAQVGRLRLDAQANIGGNVRYGSDREAEIVPGAQIGGTVERTDPLFFTNRPLIADNPVTAFIGSLLALLLLGWGLMLLRPAAVVMPGTQLRTRPLLSLGAGLAMWIGQFLLLLVLIIMAALVGQVAASLGGAFLAPLALTVMAIIAAVLLAQVWVSMAIGGWLATRMAGLSPWLAYALGATVWVLLVTVLGYIAGVLGGLLFLVGWILGLGAVTLHVIEARRRDGYPPPYPDQPPPSAAPAS